jgi:predicted small lipoprotein YifL
MRTVNVLVVTALLAAGCGQRGPLYLRESPPPGIKPEKPAPYQPVPYPKDTQDEDETNKERRTEQAK